MSTCADLMEAPPEWPGRFPTIPQSVILNVHTDKDPRETSWTWQETNVSGVWETLESDGPLEWRTYLYSWPLLVEPNIRYRLVVHDSYGDGFYVPGWITLTAENKTVLYSYVSIDDEYLYTSDSDFSEVTVDVAVGAEASLIVSGSIS